MKHILLALTVALVISGCIRKEEMRGTRIVLDSYTVSDGVVVNMHVPKRVFNFGEDFVLRVTAKNLTDAPVRVVPTGESLVDVIIVSTYPPEPTAQLTPQPGNVNRAWVLAPHETRAWDIPLKVTSDWRSRDSTHIRAMVSGLPKSQTEMVIWTNPAGGEWTHVRRDTPAY